MKLKAVSGTMLTLLLTGMLTLTFNIQLVKSEPATIIVPDNYEKIQWAIGNASDGDTIFVRTGIYYENVIIDKSISLIGENRISTIIDGGIFGTGVRVTSGYVNISGFTIRNCGPPEGGPYAGIHLDSSNMCTISGNMMNNNYVGILPDSSSNNTIFNNTFSNCAYAIGGTTMSGNNQKIFDNFISNNAFGIYLFSSNSIVSNNTISNSQRLSIKLEYCNNVSLTDNKMIDNICSLDVFGTWLPHFIHDIDVSNTVDGKPVYYLINQRDLIIDPSTFPDIGYLGLVNSTNIVIKDLNLTRSGQGLLLAYTTCSTVAHLNISFNNEGIDIFSSSNNTISDNKIMSNRDHGIELHYDCNNNTISDNTISSSGGAILMRRSDSNVIKCNTLSKNKYCILLLSSQYNSIYHNNFIDNIEQVLFDESINIWDNGREEGNYWSDYNGSDTNGDGIGDAFLPWQGVDYYPLMSPYIPADANHDGMVDGDDLFLFAKAWNSKEGDSRYNPHADFNCDGVIDGDDLFIIAKNWV